MLDEQAREYFRQAAGRRARHRLRCQQCGAAMVGLAWRRYCSNACRQKAKRQRAKDAPPELVELVADPQLASTAALDAYLHPDR